MGLQVGGKNSGSGDSAGMFAHVFNFGNGMKSRGQISGIVGSAGVFDRGHGKEGHSALLLFFLSSGKWQEVQMGMYSCFQ